MTITCRLGLHQWGYFIDGYLCRACPVCEKVQYDLHLRRQIITPRRVTLAVAMLVVGIAVAVLLSVAPARAAQPYGGCDEAWQAPRSEGAAWCRHHGWTVRPFIVVGPRNWVRYYDLPSCKYEDASSGPVPCKWNFDDGDGNGKGDAYWVTGTNTDARFHYVEGVR